MSYEKQIAIIDKIMKRVIEYCKEVPDVPDDNIELNAGNTVSRETSIRISIHTIDCTPLTRSHPSLVARREGKHLQ